MRRFLCILVAAVLFAAPSFAADTGPVLIASLRPQGVDGELAATLGDLLASELSNKTSRTVNTQAQVEIVLRAEALRQAVGVDEAAAEAARQLKAEFLLSGSVGRVGRVFVLSLELAGLSDDANKVLAGKKSHWSVLAEGAPEKLITAIDQAADRVAAVLGGTSPAAPVGLTGLGGLAGAGKGAGTGGAAVRRNVAPPAVNFEDDKLQADALAPPSSETHRHVSHKAARKRSTVAGVEVFAAPVPDVKALPEWQQLASSDMSSSEVSSLTFALKERVKR